MFRGRIIAKQTEFLEIKSEICAIRYKINRIKQKSDSEKITGASNS